MRPRHLHRGLRAVVVAGFVLLIPVQFVIREFTEQEPFPALFGPEFATAPYEETLTIAVPEAIVEDSAGRVFAVEPRTLVDDFPSSETSALNNWLRAGLDADGIALPCPSDADEEISVLEKRCPGHTRDGSVVLEDPEVAEYLRRQTEKVVDDPASITLTWRRVTYSVSDLDIVGSSAMLRVEVEL